MKTTYIKLSLSALLVGAVLLFQGCSKNDNAMGSGDAEYQITDAPIDDANVNGVFVTISDVQVDGKSISGFTKQTIDLKAYSEGNTKLLGTSHLDAKSYSNLTLVLDNNTDASGNSPGSYVLSDGTKYKLSNNATTSIVINNSWNVTKNAKSTVIIDFDIRKAIHAMSDAAVRYNFVSNDNLQSSVRIVNQDKAGTISGTYSEQVNTNADKIVVYAYKKGTYNAGTETTAQGDDAIMFKNSVTSAEVKGSLTAKTYKLAFLEAGDYELHFVSYKKDENNHFVLQSALQSNTTASGSAGNLVTVQTGVTANASSTITSL